MQNLSVWIWFVWLQLTEEGWCQIRLLCFGQRADKPQRAGKSGSRQPTGLSVLPLPGLLHSIFKTKVPNFQLTFQPRPEKNICNPGRSQNSCSNMINFHLHLSLIINVVFASSQSICGGVKTLRKYLHLCSECKVQVSIEMKTLMLQNSLKLWLMVYCDDNLWVSVPKEVMSEHKAPWMCLERWRGCPQLKCVLILTPQRPIVSHITPYHIIRLHWEYIKANINNS